MNKSPKRFAELLSQAIYQIRAKAGQSIGVIEDELGYALNRNGGEFIKYLRKGNVPSHLEDVEALARELTYRGGFEPSKCEQFLKCGGHPAPKEVSDGWFDTIGFGAAGGQRSTRTPLSTLKSYVVGPPITDPRQFFGRDYYLRRIFGLWQAFPLEHMAVIGPRRSGKTSLLHYLRKITLTDAAALRPGQRSDWLSQPESYRWVFVDFQDPRMRKLKSLLHYLSMSLGLLVDQELDLDIFMERMSKHEWRTPTIILMDELGAAIESPELDQTFWWGLRSLVNSTAAGHLAFLLSAPESPATLADEKGKTSPFFNMFNTLELGPFTEAEALDLIQSSTHLFDPSDVDWILETSQLWPCLVQTLCDERVRSLAENGTQDRPSDEWKQHALERIQAHPQLLSAGS